MVNCRTWQFSILSATVACWLNNNVQRLDLILNNVEQINEKKKRMSSRARKTEEKGLVAVTHEVLYYNRKEASTEGLGPGLLCPGSSS